MHEKNLFWKLLSNYVQDNYQLPDIGVMDKYEKSILDSGIDIDLSIPPKKIVCNDDELFFGAIAILKIFSKCGGKISKLSKFFLRIKILYFLYNFSYYLFSRNRSRFSFMIPYINC